MGRGLSPLQRDILAAVGGEDWSRPKDIRAALGKAPTPSNRSVISRALLRLCERGLIEANKGERGSARKSYSYRRSIKT